MERNLLGIFKTFYFMIIAVMMYYFLTEVIEVGLHVTYRHAFAVVLAGSAICAFLYRPNIERGVTALKGALVYSIPLLVTTTVSLFIWFVGMAPTDVISRGLSSSFVYTNMLSFALAAGALLYIFGEKGVWYNLAAILIANLLMIVTIIIENGLGSFFSEFITLIVTFADETGEIIVQAEIHELAFCLGAYLIYMLYKPMKKAWYLVLLALSLFCFVAAFKRIGIVAIVICLAFGYFLQFIEKKNRKAAQQLVTVLCVLVIIILIGYVWLIKINVFELLEKAGINTSGRVGIYQAVDKFYEFSPGFLGNGIGFLTYQLNTFIKIGVASVHNDFLQHFIDLGFFGYIIWLGSMTLIRVWYFGRKGQTHNAIMTFILTLYLVIVSSTDNTMNYPLLTGVLAILMIGCNFDSQVKETEVSLFGCSKREERQR